MCLIFFEPDFIYLSNIFVSRWMFDKKPSRCIHLNCRIEWLDIKNNWAKDALKYHKGQKKNKDRANFSRSKNQLIIPIFVSSRLW